MSDEGFFDFIFRNFQNLINVSTALFVLIPVLLEKFLKGAREKRLAVYALFMLFVTVFSSLAGQFFTSNWANKIWAGVDSQRAFLVVLVNIAFLVSAVGFVACLGFLIAALKSFFSKKNEDGSDPPTETKRLDNPGA